MRKRINASISIPLNPPIPPTFTPPLSTMRPVDLPLAATVAAVQGMRFAGAGYSLRVLGCGVQEIRSIASSRRRLEEQLAHSGERETTGNLSH